MTSFRIATAALVLWATTAAPAWSDPPQPALSTSARIDQLLDRMTLEEKLGQLTLVSRADPVEKDLARVARGEAGAMLNVVTADEIRQFRAAAQQSRLSIPLIFGLDAINVFRISFPPPIAWAATWDPELAEASAAAVAREASHIGIAWTFAPMVDISRDPRWGRVIEGAGEDPVLGAAMAAARVRGYRRGGLAASVKHFIGYGAPEAGRDYNGATIAPAELYDRYLPPFRAALEAGAETVMAAFNTVNGVPVTADPRLLTGLLRGRLNFDGVVTSDYNAVTELINHGIAEDRAAAARLAITAGVDLDMEGHAYRPHLADEVRAGRVGEAVIDAAVRRVLRFKFQLGLFDADNGQPAISAPFPDERETRAVARQVARDSIVLAKNNGDTLPIAGERTRIALIGAFAIDDQDMSWYGPAGLTKPATQTLRDAMRERLKPGQSLIYAKGTTDPCGRALETPVAAVAAAASADVVVFIVAEDCETFGEAASRANLNLSAAHQSLLEQLSATGTPVILVVNSGRPLTLGAADPLSDAVLISWNGGTEGRTALAEILLGEVAPSGKLPMTFPRSVGQIPIGYAQLPTSRPPGPDRFTSRYVDEDVTPLYPFGWGLSTTRFEISALDLSAHRIGCEGELDVSVSVRNAGLRDGKEVVQLYTRQLVASRSRPERELKAFRKVALGAGEVTRVSFTLKANELGYHDDEGRLVLEPAPFELFVGSSSLATLSRRFERTERCPRQAASGPP